MFKIPTTQRISSTLITSPFVFILDLDKLNPGYNIWLAPYKEEILVCGKNLL